MLNVVSLGILSYTQVQPRQVTLEDFLKSLSRNSGTVTREDLEKFTNFTQNYGQIG